VGAGIVGLGKEEFVMSNTIKSKATLEQRLRGLIAGTQKNSPTGSLTVGGSTYTAAALDQLFQGLLDVLSAADAAKAAWQDALLKVRSSEASVTPVLRNYVSFLVATTGNAPGTLADYGLTPRKARAPLSTEQKAVAVAKSKATRVARHTMGKKQKKAVTGTVATTVTTPPATATTPVATTHATPPTAT
jgi:hypothetical protein